MYVVHSTVTIFSSSVVLNVLFIWQNIALVRMLISLLLLLLNRIQSTMKKEKKKKYRKMNKTIDSRQ